MNCIIIILVALIILFLALKIKVVHIDSLPADKKAELNSRSKIRSMLLHNHLNDSKIEKFSTQKKRFHPQDFIEQVRRKYLNNDYYFNAALQPVTVRYANDKHGLAEKRYLAKIRSQIFAWSNSVEIEELKPIEIRLTEKEAMIHIRLKLVYHQTLIHLKLLYYGHLTKVDDMFDGTHDVYRIQLVSIRKAGVMI